MDNALSIRLRKIFSDSANAMKRTRKSATDVVDMRNKGEVWIKRDSKVFDNTGGLNVVMADFNRSNRFRRRKTRTKMDDFEGLHWSILHKFRLIISSRHRLRFSKAKKCYLFCSETFCVRNKCFPVYATQETSWATTCPQQCVLVCQGLCSDFPCHFKVKR